jgi:hypothetical protein
MRYIVGAFMLILIAIIVIVLLASGGRDGGNENVRQETVPATETALHEYADRNALARLTIDGKVVGDNEHRAVRITVNKDYRTIDILKGYSGDVLSSQSFPNTSEGFETFLYALENAGFAKERKAKITDERGVCPSGRRFIYELIENGEQKLRSWSTSCEDTHGTFNGSRGSVRSLFQDQIPEYRKVVDDVDL